MENKRWWMLAGLVVLLILSLVFYHFRVTVPERNQKKAKALYREALELESRGELGKAAKKLQEALAVFPDLKEAQVKLKKVKQKIAERTGERSTGGSSRKGDSFPQLSTSTVVGFKEPDDLRILFPTYYSGYERSEPTQNELGAFCNFQPVIESDAQSIEVTIWRQKDTSDAAGFIGRVSKVSYPENKKEFLFKEKYPAYFGTGQINHATYVWVVGRLVFELHARAKEGNPAELWDELNGLAMRFKL